MAKKRKRSGVGRAYKTKKAANKRRWKSVTSGKPVMVRVPRACAIRQSGDKKGKIRPGCKIGKNGSAYCDAALNLPKTARDRRYKPHLIVDCS